MSVQETWGEALDVLWGHLGSGDTVLSQVMRYGLVLLLLAGAAWQVKSGHDMMVELEDPVPLFAPPVNTIGEQGRVEELLRVFDGVMALRTGGKDTVTIMEATHRQPYRPNVGETAASDLVPVAEALPPLMTVRSIMILEDRRAAVMDIETEGTGIIVTEGMKFDKGHGKILKISKDRVVVVWMRKRMEIVIDPR